MSKKEDKVKIENPKEVVHALEVLFASHYISKKRLYWENFVRGIFFSVGGIIGATLVIALIIWILSLFDSVTFIKDIKDTIQQGSTLH